MRRTSWASRRRRRRGTLEREVAARAEASDPSSLAETVETQRRVLAAVLRLEEPYRSTVSLLSGRRPPPGERSP